MQIRSFHVTSNEVILKTRRTNCNAISFPSVIKLMAINKKSLKAVNILIITVKSVNNSCYCVCRELSIIKYYGINYHSISFICDIINCKFHIFYAAKAICEGPVVCLFTDEKRVLGKIDAYSEKSPLLCTFTLSYSHMLRFSGKPLYDSH